MVEVDRVDRYKGRDGKLYDISLQDVEQAMGGVGYQIEHVTWEGRGLGKRPTTFSVYVDPQQEYHYEVARWINGRVKDTAVVTYDTHRCTFGCTCKGARESARSQAVKRGFCDHVDQLTKHAARGLAPLEKPARELQAERTLPQWTFRPSSTSADGAAATDSSPASLPIPTPSSVRTVYETFSMPAVRRSLPH